MQCAACGATNPDTAAWCGQCYQRFQAEPAAPAPVPPPSANGDAPRPLTPTTEGFRRRDDVLEWSCSQCGHFNPMELQRCEVCGTSFVARFRESEPAAPRNWNAALVMTAVAPGAGHLAVGRYGSGAARLLLFCSWMLGALLLLTSGGSGAVVVAAPLLLGALTLWALSLIDIYRLSNGDNEILVGRVQLWLVVGVLILLVLSLFGTVGTAGPSAPS